MSDTTEAQLIGMVVALAKHLLHVPAHEHVAVSIGPDASMKDLWRVSVTYASFSLEKCNASLRAALTLVMEQLANEVERQHARAETLLEQVRDA